MEIVESREGATTIIEPIGRLDNNSARTFEKKIEAVTAGEIPVLIIDCSRLDYVSSSGLRVFLVAAKRTTNAKGKLALCAMQPHVKEVFDVSGFSSILNIRATRKEALVQTAKGTEMTNPRGGTRPGGARPGGSRPGSNRPGSTHPGGARPGGASLGGTRPRGSPMGGDPSAQSETAPPMEPVSHVSSEESFEKEPLSSDPVKSSPVESSPAEVVPTRPASSAAPSSAVAKRPSRPVPPRPPSTRSAGKPGRRFAPPPPPSAKAPEAPPATTQLSLVSRPEVSGPETSGLEQPGQPASPSPPARMLRSNSRFPR